MMCPKHKIPYEFVSDDGYMMVTQCPKCVAEREEMENQRIGNN